MSYDEQRARATRSDLWITWKAPPELPDPDAWRDPTWETDPNPDPPEDPADGS